MRFSEDDRRHMSRALALARRGLGKTSPNPMVGAVIVRDGSLIGEGAHLQLGAPHAEVAAIVAAGGQCKGATLYVTLEPCSHHGRTPPCAGAVIRAGIERVVAAVEDPNPLVRGKGFEALRAAGITVDVGLMEEEAQKLNEVFFTFHTLQRPFFIAKWAMTLDGRTSSDTGSSKWISNEESREYVHRIRSQCDAVMVGVGTVIQDNPSLTVRLKGYAGRQPTHVILDGSLRSPLRSSCFSRRAGAPAFIVASSSAPAERIHRAEQAGIKVLRVETRRHIVPMEDLSRLLYREGVTSVLVEGGRGIHTSLFEAGLVDKAIIFIAPKIVGGSRANTPIEDLGIASMENALDLRDVEIRHFGHDVCIEGYVRKISEQNT